MKVIQARSIKIYTKMGIYAQISSSREKGMCQKVGLPGRQKTKQKPLMPQMPGGNRKSSKCFNWERGYSMCTEQIELRTAILLYLLFSPFRKEKPPFGNEPISSKDL